MDHFNIKESIFCFIRDLELSDVSFLNNKYNFKYLYNAYKKEIKDILGEVPYLSDKDQHDYKDKIFINSFNWLSNTQIVDILISEINYLNRKNKITIGNDYFYFTLNLIIRYWLYNYRGINVVNNNIDIVNNNIKFVNSNIDVLSGFYDFKKDLKLNDKVEYITKKYRSCYILKELVNNEADKYFSNFLNNIDYLFLFNEPSGDKCYKVFNDYGKIPPMFYIEPSTNIISFICLKL